MDTAPLIPLGTTAVINASELMVKLVAAILVAKVAPKLTAVAPVNPAPLIAKLLPAVVLAPIDEIDR